MLIDDKCSIYEHRPRTCRVYDCRVFPAAGVTIDDPDKALIETNTRAWSSMVQLRRTPHSSRCSPSSCKMRSSDESRSHTRFGSNSHARVLAQFRLCPSRCVKDLST